MEKIKLIVPREELGGISRLENLKLNLNGRKPRRGKNLYKRRLNQLRRTLR